jgi:hypothetical protein
MSTRAPHFIITGALTGVCHYAQVGTELLKWLLSEGTIPSLGMMSSMAVNLSVAIFAVRLILMICRFVLAASTIIGSLEDQCVAWARHKLVDLANWMLARLTQDSPRP